MKLISLNYSGVALAKVVSKQKITLLCYSSVEASHYVKVCDNEHELFHELRLKLVVFNSETETHSTDMHEHRHSLGESLGSFLIIRH